MYASVVLIRYQPRTSVVKFWFCNIKCFVIHMFSLCYSVRSYDEVGIDDTCYRFPLSINAGVSNDPLSRLADRRVEYTCIPGFEQVSPAIESECSQSGDDFLWDVNVIECSSEFLCCCTFLCPVWRVDAFARFLMMHLSPPIYLICRDSGQWFPSSSP